MTKTVAEYQCEIQEAMQKIQELQEACSHPTFFLGFYSYRPGAMYATRICEACRKPLEGITKEESEKMWADYYQPMKDLQEEMKKELDHKS